MNRKVSTLCYVKKDGKTLMLHRVKRDGDIHKDKWNGLGGKLEDGETPEEGIIREVKEESGLDIFSPQLYGVMSFPKFKDDEDWLVFLYIATKFQGELIECDEGNLEWIDDEKICELNLWEGDHLFFEWLDRREFFSAKFCYEDGKLLSHDVTFYSDRMFSR